MSPVQFREHVYETKETKIQSELDEANMRNWRYDGIPRNLKIMLGSAANNLPKGIK